MTNSLFTVLLLTRGDSHTVSLDVHLCLASISTKQTISLGTLPLVAVQYL